MPINKNKLSRAIVLSAVLMSIFFAGYFFNVYARNFLNKPKNLQIEAPFLGPEKAPITITEFADFYCPYCSKGAATIRSLMDLYPGKIKWIFKHYPLNVQSNKGSLPAHLASACAQEQGKFWEFHDKIFEARKLLKKEDFLSIAKELNLDRTNFEECVDKEKYRTWILKEHKEGTAKGVTGTPKFLVNQYEISGAYPLDYFKEIVDSILDPKNKKAPKGIQEFGKEAIIEFGDLSDKPFQGNENASVVLVEFSDYHCPFCRKLDVSLQQAVDEVGNDFKRIFRHFPLDMHKDAFALHKAAECAHQQGKFWAYHNALFEMPRTEQNKSGFLKLAEELLLDRNSFDACLESEAVSAVIQKDIEAGMNAGVRGTPTVFINGKKRSGAMSLNTLKDLIEAEKAK